LIDMKYIVTLMLAVIVLYMVMPGTSQTEVDHRTSRQESQHTQRSKPRAVHQGSSVVALKKNGKRSGSQASVHTQSDTVSSLINDPSAVDDSNVSSTRTETHALELESDHKEEYGDAEREPEVDDLIFSTDREGIKSAMGELIPELYECYEAWLKTNNELQGRMVISFIIDHQASVKDGESAAVSQVKEAQLMIDELAHPMMKGCLLNSAESLKFEAVDEPIEVKYPFYFSKSE
jgi:hypothetical protein